MPLPIESFILPSSLDEAETRQKDLTLDVQSIQAQLGDKQRSDENGRRLSSKEYWKWKRKAQHALNQKLNELRAVKRWAHSERKKSWEPRQSVDSEDVYEHLRKLHRLLVNLRNEDVDFDKDEEIQIDSAGDYLIRVDENS